MARRAAPRCRRLAAADAVGRGRRGHDGRLALALRRDDRRRARRRLRGGVAVGFLLEHEPAPDDRHIEIHRPLQPPPSETFLAGEVIAVGGGRIELRVPRGPVELELRPDASIEELRRADASRFAPGDAVNLGGEQGDFGLVLTGVVALEPEASP